MATATPTAPDTATSGATNGATKKKEDASLPRPVFTNAEAGALEFPSSNSRIYNYYTPRRHKGTMYEDVTVEVQPDPAHYLSQNWVYAFHDGVAGFPASWTALKSSDWHTFRDPNEEWEKTIYFNNANVVRQISNNIANATETKAFDRWDPSWVKVVANHVGASMHAEHGLGMHVFLPAQRDAPTNMHNNAICVNSMHKLRFAQDLALYNLALADALPDFDGSIHREVWMQDPAWQATRENVEKITGIRDWAEAVFVANCIYEPLVGELFRSQFVMQVAASHGDYTTPSVVGAGEGDFFRDLRYTVDMFGILVNDKDHGAENKETLQGYVDQWTPLSMTAARHLQPLWSQPGHRVMRFEDGFDAAKQRFGRILSDFGLTAPKEV